MWSTKRKTTMQFVNEVAPIHNYKYNYERVNYTNSNTKVEIGCPIHGSFWQTPAHHLKYGCPLCGDTRKTKESVIIAAQKVHGTFYNYDEIIYINNKIKIKVGCPIHGSFWIRPENHIQQKQGCPICSKTKKLTTNEFIFRSNKIHNCKYDYKKSIYITNKEKIEIICPIHGSFWQRPYHHLVGHGCPVCAKEKKISKNETTLREIIKKDFPFLRIEPNFREHPLLNGLEIDIWLPDIELGIEWNGIYWHSFIDRKKKDNTKKQILGEKLIQIIDTGRVNDNFVECKYNEIIKLKIQKEIKMEHFFS